MVPPALWASGGQKRPGLQQLEDKRGGEEEAQGGRDKLLPVFLRKATQKGSILIQNRSPEQDRYMVPTFEGNVALLCCNGLGYPFRIPKLRKTIPTCRK